MSNDFQDPAEPYKIENKIDVTSVGEDPAPSETETTDTTKVETADVTVTETHTEAPSE